MAGGGQHDAKQKGRFLGLQMTARQVVSLLASAGGLTTTVTAASQKLTSALLSMMPESNMIQASRSARHGLWPRC
jgi:hypothetical protein